MKYLQGFIFYKFWHKKQLPLIKPMKHTAFLLITFCFSILFSGCNTEVIEEEDLMEIALKELEITIRTKQDPRATFTFEQYEELLSVLDNEKFIVLPIKDFKDSINKEKVLIGLRHDIDCHPFKALEMAKMEKSHGFRATYYILASAAYYGEFINEEIVRNECMEKIYKEIHSLGTEIGIHNDLISNMILHGINPYTFNHKELSFYNSLGIEVVGTAAHGSYITAETAMNYEIFSDFAEVTSIEYEGQTYEIGQYSLKDFGFDYEAYFVYFDHYYSDSSKNWTEEGDFESFLEALGNSKLGTKIQLLTHPVWWGK